MTFTSRSPDIATLGSSCRPKRQFKLFCVVTSNEVIIQIRFALTE